MAFNKKYPLKPLELLFKRFSLWVGQSYFDIPVTRSAEIDPQTIKRILLLRYDKIGDMVVSLPTIDALREFYPEIEIDVLASPRNERIIRDDPRVTNSYLFTKNVFKDFATILRMRRRKYDLVISMISLSSVTSLHLSQLLGKGAIRVGLGQVKHERFYHHYLPVDHSLREHMILQTLRILTPLGIDTSKVATTAELHIAESTAHSASKTFALWREELGSDNKFFGVNISAGLPNRIWAEVRYTELVSRLSTDYPEKNLALLFAPTDREKALRIQSNSGSCAALLPEGLDIVEVAALIKPLELLITPDTSLTHIARSFEVPVVGLYSNHEQNTSEWRPFGQEYGLVQAQAYDDIFDITVEQVLAEVRVTLREVEHVQ